MASSKGQKITLIIDSQMENTVLIAMAVRGLCALTSLSENEINRIELCVVEVVNNAIEHAYENKKGHSVELSFIVIPEEKVVITVGDYGKKLTSSLDDIMTCFQSVNFEDPATWACSGRGLTIVSRIMDEMSYKTENGCNQFSMVRYLAK